MTWRVGMWAECIDGGEWWDCESGDIDKIGPETGDVFIVRALECSARDQRSFFRRLFTKKVVRLNFAPWPSQYFTSLCFRPLVEDEANAEMIARIKNCKPRREHPPARIAPFEPVVAPTFGDVVVSARHTLSSPSGHVAERRNG